MHRIPCKSKVKEGRKQGFSDLEYSGSAKCNGVCFILISLTDLVDYGGRSVTIMLILADVTIR